MAAKKKSKATVEVNVKDLEKLAAAAAALSEAASAMIFGADDPAVRAKLKKKSKR
jgi:hypothetical protein